VKDLYDRKYYDKGLFQIALQTWDDLRSMPVDDVTRRTGASFQEKDNAYLVPFLDSHYCVHPRGNVVSLHGITLDAQQHFQLHLVLLSYLTQTTMDDPTGRMISEKQLPGGMTFFKGVHALGTDPLVKAYGRNPEGFRELGRFYGGIEEKFGDVCFTLRVLPKIPIRFIFHAEDDEFPASLKAMFDSSIEKHFRQPDLVWALFNLTVEHLLRPREAAVTD